MSNEAQSGLEQALEQGVALLDFWAPWCGPCRMQGPILDEVAQKADPATAIHKVNVDEHGELAARFGVHSIPTLILLKDGNEVRRFVGVQSSDTLLEALQNTA